MSTTIEPSPETTNLTQRAVAGTVWTGMSTAGRQLLTVASVATVARLLGPSAYGVMAMATLVTNFIINFRDLGTGTAIIQRRQVSNRLLSSLFWVNFAIGITLSSLICLASPFVAAFFHAPELVKILCVLSLSFLFTSCGVVHSSLLIRNMRFRNLAAADLTAAVCAYLVALSFAYGGFGVWALVFASLTTSIVASIGYWIGSGWRPSREFEKAEVQSVAKFSLNLSGFGLVNYFARNADNIVVGKVLGKALLGDYQMAYNLMLTPIQNISAVISQAVFPAFARIQDDNERFRQAYTRSCMLLALISFPVMAGLGVVADPMIRTILGEKWIGAIRVFQVLAPVGVIQSVQTTVGQIYMAKGRTDIFFRWGLFAAVVLVISFLVGIHFGIVGVAIAYCTAYVAVLMIPGLMVPFRLIGLRVADFGKALLPQILITMLMAGVCIGWMRLLPVIGVKSLWVIFLSTVVLGAGVYIVTMLLVWPPVMSHLEMAMSSSGRAGLVMMLTRARGLGRGPRNGRADGG